VAGRVSPVERIRAEIDQLFSSDRELASTLEDVARLSVRSMLQTRGVPEVSPAGQRTCDQQGYGGRCCIWTVHGPLRLRQRSGVRLPRPARRMRPRCAGSPVPRPRARNAASEVLHQRMPGHHDPGGSVSRELAHRTQPRLEAAVVGLDVVVGVPVGATPRRPKQLLRTPLGRPRLGR
jgi:hypothetical protein